MWQSVGHLESDNLEKNNPAVHFKVLNKILQFQLNPFSGSLIITGEKMLQTDGRTDRQDRNIYASSPLGGGIIVVSAFDLILFYKK